MASAPIQAIHPALAGRYRIEGMREGASQTFKKGAALVRSTAGDGTGHRVVVATDSTLGITAAANALVGFAAEDASGTTNAYISVYCADAQTEFIGNICTAAVADQASDVDFVGVAAGLVPDTTNAVWRVDMNDTAANKFVMVTRLYDAAGDTNGRVCFRILDHVEAAQAKAF